jgi:hypothetical protein
LRGVLDQGNGVEVVVLDFENNEGSDEIFNNKNRKTLVLNELPVEEEVESVLRASFDQLSQKFEKSTPIVSIQELD